MMVNKHDFWRFSKVVDMMREMVNFNFFDQEQGWTTFFGLFYLKDHGFTSESTGYLLTFLLGLSDGVCLVVHGLRLSAFHLAQALKIACLQRWPQALFKTLL